MSFGHWTGFTSIKCPFLSGWVLWSCRPVKSPMVHRNQGSQMKLALYGTYWVFTAHDISTQSLSCIALVIIDGAHISGRVHAHISGDSDCVGHILCYAHRPITCHIPVLLLCSPMVHRCLGSQIKLALYGTYCELHTHDFNTSSLSGFTVEAHRHYDSELILTFMGLIGCYMHSIWHLYYVLLYFPFTMHI